MGILGNLLKTAAIAGASAIPTVGAVAGPAVAGALGGPGAAGKVAGAAGKAIGGKLFGGEAPLEGVAEQASAEQVGQRVSENIASQFTPDMVARDPIGQIAAIQIMNGSEDLSQLFSFRKGIGIGG